MTFKGIEEFVLLAVGALAGAFLRYKIVSSPILLANTLPINVLAVNIIGSFILGIFSILSSLWNLDTKYSLLIAIGFCDSRQYYTMALNIFSNIGLSIGAIYAGRIISSIIMSQLG